MCSDKFAHGLYQGSRNHPARRHPHHSRNGIHATTTHKSTRTNIPRHPQVGTTRHNTQLQGHDHTHGRRPPSHTHTRERKIILPATKPLLRNHMPHTSHPPRHIHLHPSENPHRSLASPVTISHTTLHTTQHKHHNTHPKIREPQDPQNITTPNRRHPTPQSQT